MPGCLVPMAVVVGVHPTVDPGFARQAGEQVADLRLLDSWLGWVRLAVFWLDGERVPVDPVGQLGWPEVDHA